MLTNSKKQTKANGRTNNNGEHSSELMELFEEQLKDILWVEKALIKAIPEMITLATSDDLIFVLTYHLHQTYEQVSRLEKVFKAIDKIPSETKCNAMEEMIAEANEMMEKCEKGPKCDVVIIAATQKIEHYEIASYGTLREFAEILGLKEAEMLLMKTLREEKTADQKLTDVAVQGVNMEAASG